MDDDSISQFQKCIKEIYLQREEILKAFIAKYGINDPARLIQETHFGPDKITWSVRVKDA